MESAIRWIVLYGGILFWAYMETRIFFKFCKNILGVRKEREQWFAPMLFAVTLLMLCVPVHSHIPQVFGFTLAAYWLCYGGRAQKIGAALHGAFIIYYFAYFRIAVEAGLYLGGYSGTFLYYVGILLGYVVVMVLEIAVGEACGEVDEEPDVWMYVGTSVISYILLMVLRYMMEHGADSNMILVAFLLVSLFVIIDFAMFVHYQRDVYKKKQIRQFSEFQKKSELEQDHFRRLEEVYGEFRGLAHDMNRYLSVLFSMKGNEESEAEKTELAEEIRYRIGEVNREIYCTRPVLNALLNEKMKKCKDDRIKMELFVEPGFDLTELDDYAVIGIVSNLIDNAIEATEKRLQDRWITVNMFAVNDGKQKFIRVENSQLESAADRKGIFETSKDDKIRHGYGLKNVQKLVEEKQGKLRLKSEGERFTAEVVF